MADHSPVPTGLARYQSYIGAMLGEYRLEQVLRESETGPIFLARGGQASFELRLLTVPPDLTPQDRIVFLGHFQREANHIAALQHPGLLPLLDYGIYQSFPYLVMPHLALRSLSSYLAKNGALDALLAGRYLDHIAAALEYAHALAALHLNLSTDCIYLKEDRSLLVAGPGIVRMIEAGGALESPASSSTPQKDEQNSPVIPSLRSGQALSEAKDLRPPVPQILSEAKDDMNRFLLRDRQNRPLYGFGPGSSPAPEQLLGNPVDTYTDVYALGAVLYRMLTGHRVFRGGSAEELAQQHLNAAVPSLNKWRAGLQPQVDDLIGRAMAKEPAQRFRQPGQLANAYHDIVAPNDTQRKAFVMQAPSLAPTPAPQPGAAPLAARGLQPRQQTRPAGSASSAGISRRRLLVAGGGAAVAIAAVTVFATHYLVGSTAPVASTTTTTSSGGSSSTSSGTSVTPPGHSGTVLARTSDVPVNGAKTFPLANSSNPGILVHLPDNRFVAFNSTCTHAGCAVNYDSQNHLLVCPCHQAVFDPAKGASVVQGPAPSPLPSIPIKVNADNTITTQG